MTTNITYSIALAIVALAGAIALFFRAIMVRRLNVIFLSLILFLVFVAAGAWTAFLIAQKSYNRVKGIFHGRSGIEVYTALFGKSNHNCVEILSFQDQTLPKIDYAIWLHFRTCPNELKRILQLHQYEAKTIATSGMTPSGPLANNEWFKPESLGDTILVFTYKKDEMGNLQEIYASRDSVTAFCVDIQD